jgi:hypothetical protein
VTKLRSPAIASNPVSKTTVPEGAVVASSVWSGRVCAGDDAAAARSTASAPVV